MAPLHDIAHVGHVELLTPEPEKSLDFFVNVLGLTENGRDGDSVYLRTWDDYEHHTVKLTAHSKSGIRLMGLRASSQEALDRRVQAMEAAGRGIDRTGTAGRLHHIAFTTDTREDILRAADICLENDVFIETGPHKHAIQQTFFLISSGSEPSGTLLVVAPDWKTISWSESERAKGQAWGLKTIESFHTHGTPPV